MFEGNAFHGHNFIFSESKTLIGLLSHFNSKHKWTIDTYNNVRSIKFNLNVFRTLAWNVSST